MIKMGSS